MEWQGGRQSAAVHARQRRLCRVAGAAEVGNDARSPGIAEVRGVEAVARQPRKHPRQACAAIGSSVDMMVEVYRA